MRYFSGYTFLELLVVLTLILIAAAAAMPQWQSLLLSQEADVQINQLYAEINFAREAAMLRGAVVTLCKSSDGQHCGGQWRDGQLIFMDEQNDQTVQPDTILRVFSGLMQNGFVCWQGMHSSDYLQFTPAGLQPGHNGTFIFCPANHDNHYSRAIIISPTGRLRFSRDSDHDGVDEGEDGKPLECNF